MRKITVAGIAAALAIALYAIVTLLGGSSPAQVTAFSVMHHDSAAGPAEQPAAPAPKAVAAVPAAPAWPRAYTVKAGDTLSSIARAEYGPGKVSWWPSILYWNKQVDRCSTPLTAGEHLKIPAPYTQKLPYCPPPPPPAAPPQPASQPAAQAAPVQQAAATSGGCGLSGTLSFSQLEQLWDCAGGNPGDAATAACIASHESGGNQYATGSEGERGYWQIHPDHGSMSTYDPMGNAHAAITLSDNGSNWGQWSTAASCGV